MHINLNSNHLYLGVKGHVGCDSFTRLVQSKVDTSAKVAWASVAGRLVQEGDRRLYDMGKTWKSKSLV